MEVKTIEHKPYGGTIITPANRNQYKKAMIDYFIDRNRLEYDKRKKDIENSSSTEDKKQELFAQLEADTPVGEYLESLAEKFAVYQSSKENKHFSSWMKGKTSFKYKGQEFPVLYKEDKDFIEIENIDGLQ